ncbi:TFIIB-type zinc ribbon-containing protein [Crossiella cryophila]|uniref:Zn-finger nucleic acid-binding protein n=1 Tax=Crossiella cryophila TaxID=43355 RepID=A0A7W7C791_9PSEU|nr:zf-TFIIB domain-containing protein [Crossiella cryophila]MBB4674538.1 Zn-finger nucleic acid-binding protein [Crossiella cryophila]
MICPKCQDIMQTVDRTGVHIDVCQDCKGIFLDRGELERLIDAALIYHQAAEAREREAAAAAAASTATSGANPVPVDQPVAAQPPPYQPEPGYPPPPPAYHQPPGYAPPPVPPGYGQPAPYGHDPYAHDPYYRRRKKKDFLSELFD